jgi:hypothetical protein
MLDNKDLWMDGEEVVRRVNEMIEAKRAAAEGLAKKKPARKSAAKKSAPKTSVQ